jgi:hypothetical protein
MYELPTSVEVGGKNHPIRKDGDYRMILDCMVALDDDELEEKERILSSIAIFYEEIQSIEDIFKVFEQSEIKEATEKMFEFIQCGEDQSDGYKSNIKLVDWEQDEKIICSAINKVAECEIRLQPYIHWWTFISYYMGVGESVLSTVIAIRDKIARGKKLEKWETKFKNDNPNYFKWKKDIKAQKEAEEWVKSIWNK